MIVPIVCVVFVLVSCFVMWFTVSFSSLAIILLRGSWLLFNCMFCVSSVGVQSVIAAFPAVHTHFLCFLRSMVDTEGS